MSMEKQGIIVGISGSGTTMKAFYEATQDGRLSKTEIVGVFSTNPNTTGLDFAKNFKTLDSEKDLLVLDHRLSTYGKDTINFIEARKDRFKLFCQYGLEPFTPEIVIDYLEAEGKKGINQHGGALNPDKYDFGGFGMSCSERFNAARIMFVRETGRNYYQYPVSQVLEKEYDKGLVYRRGRVPILKTDWVEDLKERVKVAEWDVQIDTLRDFEKGIETTASPMKDLVRYWEQPLLELVKGIARRLYDKDGNEIQSPKFESLITPESNYSIYDVRRLVGSLYPKKPVLVI